VELKELKLFHELESHKRSAKDFGEFVTLCASNLANVSDPFGRFCAVGDFKANTRHLLLFCEAGDPLELGELHGCVLSEDNSLIMEDVNLAQDLHF
jgi:hypothetical protein